MSTMTLVKSGTQPMLPDLACLEMRARLMRVRTDLAILAGQLPTGEEAQDKLRLALSVVEEVYI